jgi:predicted cation transporter
MSETATAALKAVLFGLCRNGVSALAGLLITIGWLHSDQISSADISAIAGGAVLLAVAAITSIRNKTKVKRIIEAALVLPQGASYADAKAIAKEPPDEAG